MTIIALLLATACGDDRIVTVYPLQKVDPQKSYGHEWLCLNPTTYRIGEEKVVSSTVGILREYRRCTILSAKDWECSYSDGSGSFGFRSGEYWQSPVWAISEHEWDVVSMVTCFGSKQPQDPPGSCNQVWILLYPLDRPAHRGAIHMNSTAHFASADR